MFLLWDWDTPLHVNVPTDITIVPVLFMEPFLEETTKLLHRRLHILTQNLSKPLLSCSLSHRFRSFALEVHPLGLGFWDLSITELHPAVLFCDSVHLFLWWRVVATHICDYKVDLEWSYDNLPPFLGSILKTLNPHSSWEAGSISSDRHNFSPMVRALSPIIQLMAPPTCECHLLPLYGYLAGLRFL